MRDKRGKRLLRSSARPSVLGSGLLERMRSTTLALLGVTAAFGLGTVAVALNQSWPLVAGSPIPAAPSLEQGVGKASVASRAARDSRSRRDTGSRSRSGAAGRRADASPSPAGSEALPVDSGSSGEFVVSPAAPAEPQGGRPGGKADDRSPAPAAAKPPAPPAAPTPSAPSQPAAAASPPPSVAETPPPAATTSAIPDEESNVPSWSKGKGHAYGRSDDHRDD